MDCSCDVCKSACIHKPGWFAPGETTKAAELLGLTEQEFFDQYLGVDFWVDSPPVFVLAPAITSMMPGSVYPFRPTGRCVFFKEGRCSIHEAKPRECRFADHTKTMEECSEDRGKMVDEWKKEEHQQYIADILGYKPVKPEAGIFDIFGLLF